MKVYFSCSSYEIRKYLDTYRLITKNIKDLGHEICGDWLSSVNKVVAEEENEIVRSQRLREEGIAAVKAADLLVAEVSIQSIGVGYQIATALDQKKPVLCLYSLEFGLKRPSQIIKATNSPLITFRQYSAKTIHKILAEYFKKYRKQQLIKFNFIITPEIEEYLDWKSNFGRLSKSELLRELVVEKIILTDEEYSDSLRKRNQGS